MNKYFAQAFSLKSLSLLALSISLVGCGNGSWWSNDEPTLEVEHIRKAIPSRVSQRESWAQDIYDIMQAINERSNEPLPDHELNTVYMSARRREEKKRARMNDYGRD